MFFLGILRHFLVTFSLQDRPFLVRFQDGAEPEHLDMVFWGVGVGGFWVNGETYRNGWFSLGGNMLVNGEDQEAM